MKETPNEEAKSTNTPFSGVSLKNNKFKSLFGRSNTEKSPNKPDFSKRYVPSTLPMPISQSTMIKKKNKKEEDTATDVSKRSRLSLPMISVIKGKHAADYCEVSSSSNKMNSSLREQTSPANKSPVKPIITTTRISKNQLVYLLHLFLLCHIFTSVYYLVCFSMILSLFWFT